MLERVDGEGATSSQLAVLRVCIDKGALDIRSWAERRLRAMQEKVRECLRPGVRFSAGGGTGTGNGR